MSHNPNRGVAGAGGPIRLASELFRVSFSTLELFDTNANVNTPEAKEKYDQYVARVKAYRDNINNIKETSSEEEALSFLEAARDQMKVVMENVGLDPCKDNRIRRHWVKAEENKKKYKEIPSPQSVATPHQKKGDPICFSIGVTFGAKKLDPDENRELVFSTMFESSLLSYTLAHPGKLGRNISSPSGNAPIKRQAMDSIYLRSIDPSNGTRTRWAPIDYHDRMTVKECERKMKNIPTTQIRFISCRTRFVLMAAYDKSKSSVVEKIIDLDKEGKQLLEALKRRELRNIVSPTAIQSVTSKGKERAHAYFQHDDIPAALPEDAGKAVKFDSKKAFKALEPRSCLLLLGPDPFSVQGIKNP